MIRKVRVTVHRITREHAVITLMVDDEKGTHQDLHDEAANKANVWKLDETHVDHFASHFEWLEPHHD